MQKNSLIHKITKITVDITFYLGIIGCFFIPYFVKWWIKLNQLSSLAEIKLNIILYLSAFIALWIVWQLRMILKSIMNKNPFTKETINALKTIAISMFLLMLIYGIKLIIMFSVGTIILFIAFGIATLMILTIKDIFKQAVIYKEESDWTV